MSQALHKVTADHIGKENAANCAEEFYTNDDFLLKGGKKSSSDFAEGFQDVEITGGKAEVVHNGNAGGKKKNIMQRILDYIFPPGSMLSSAFTLGSSTLGAGILGLPFAFNMTGFASSIVLLVVITILTVFSLWLLAVCSDISRKRTYEEVLRALMGRGYDWVIAFCLCGFSAGGGIGYVISIGNILTPVFDYPDVPPFLRTHWGNKLITTLIWLVFILPLCLPKGIDSLRHASMIGCLFILFFVICIMYDAISYGIKHGVRKDLVPIGTGNLCMEGLSMVMFACLVQINAFEVYYEMSHPTPRRMLRDGTIAMSSCCLLYILAGFFGYMRFGKEVNDSILLLYRPRESVIFAISYVGILFKICVAFSLHQLPFRDAIYHVIGWDVYRMSWLKNALCCSFFATLLLVFGLFVPSINIVFGFVGAFCGGFIGFVFPALMYMYCGDFSPKKRGWGLYFLTYILLITGCFAIVFGTGATIYGIVVR